VLGVAVILAISISNGSTMEAVADVFAQASGKAQLSVKQRQHARPRFQGVGAAPGAGGRGVQTAVPVLLGQALLGGEELAGGMAISMLARRAAG